MAAGREKFQTFLHRVGDRIGRIDWEHPAIKRLADTHDYDTALEVNEFYSDKEVPRADNPDRAVDEVYDKILTRLYRIYPQRYLNDEYRLEGLNKIHSIIDTRQEEKGDVHISSLYYRELPGDEVLETDALVLDHSAIYTCLNKQTRQRVFRFPNLMESLSGERDYVEKAELPWDTTLRLIDEALGSEEVSTPVYHPGDLEEKIGDEFERHYPYEILDYLEEVTEPFDIAPRSEVPEEVLEEFAEMEEDFRISVGAKRVADNPFIVTLDRDFWDLKDYTGIHAGPPDIARLVVSAGRDGRADISDYSPLATA